MSEPTLRQRTKKGLLWAGAEAGARAFLQLGVLAILARLLTPDDYGIVGAGMIIVGVSQIFAQLGVGPAIVQRADVTPEQLDAAFYASVLLGFVTAAVVYLFSPFLADFFRIPALAVTLHALAIIFPLTGISVVSESLLTRDLRFDLIARSEVLSYLIGYGGVGVALAFLKFGAWSLVGAQIVQTLVKTTLLFSFQSWRPRLRFQPSCLKGLLHFSSGITLARLANYMATSGDTLVVGRCLGPAMLGIYGRANQIMVAPAVLVGNVLEKVLFPAMAKVQENNEQLTRVYRQGVGLLATLMIPGSVALYLLAPEIIQLLLGPKWTDAVFPLQIFSIGLLCRTSTKLSNSLIRAKGAVYRMAWTQFIYAGSTVGFAYIGQHWGIKGACMGVLSSIILCFFLSAALSLRLIEMRWRDFIISHLPGLWLAIAVYIVGWLVCRALRGYALPHVAVVSLAGGAMALIAMLLAMAFPTIFLGSDGVRLREKAQNLFLKTARLSS